MAFPDDCGCCAPFVYQFNWRADFFLNGYLAGFVQSPKLIGSGDGSIPKDGDWVQFSSSGRSHFGILADGSLWGWGEAPLGDGTMNPSVRPKKISDGPWKYISAGGLAKDSSLPENELFRSPLVVGIKRDGTMWSWGSPDRGGLGSGECYPELSASVPVAVACPVSYAVPSGDVFFYGGDTAPPTTLTLGNSDVPATLGIRRTWTIAGVIVTNSGQGYKSPPTVTSVPSAEGFSAQVEMEYSVASAVVVDQGEGYRQGDTVVLFSPGKNGTATGTAIVSGGKVISVTVNPGPTIYYSSPPSLTIVGTGRGARAECVLSGTVLGLTASWSSVEFPQSLLLNGGDPEVAAACTISQRTFTIDGIDVISPGSYSRQDEQIPIPGGLGIAVLGESASPISIQGSAQAVGCGRYHADDGAVLPFQLSIADRFGTTTWNTSNQQLPSEAYLMFGEPGREPVQLDIVPGMVVFGEVLSYLAQLSTRVDGVQHGAYVKVIYGAAPPSPPGVIPNSPAPHMSRDGVFGQIGPFPRKSGGDIANIDVTPQGAIGARCTSTSGRWRLVKAGSLTPFATSGNWSIVDQIGRYFVLEQTAATETPFTGSGDEFEWPRKFTLDYYSPSGDYPQPPPALTTGFGQHGGVIYPIKGDTKINETIPSLSEQEPHKYRTWPEFLATAGNAPAASRLFKLPAPAFQVPAYYGPRYTSVDPSHIAVVVGPAVCSTPVELSASSVSISALGQCYMWDISVSVTKQGGGYRTVPDILVTTARLSPGRVGNSSDWKQVEVGNECVNAVNESNEIFFWGGDHVWEPTKIGYPVKFTPTEGYFTNDKFVSPQSTDAFTAPETLGYQWEISGGYFQTCQVGGGTGGTGAGGVGPPPTLGITTAPFSVFVHDQTNLYIGDPLPLYEVTNVTSPTGLTTWNCPPILAGSEWRNCEAGVGPCNPLQTPESIAEYTWQGNIIDGARDARFRWHAPNLGGLCSTFGGRHNWISLYMGYLSTFGKYAPSPPYSREIFGVSPGNYTVGWNAHNRLTAPSVPWGQTTISKPTGQIKLFRQGGAVFAAAGNGVWSISQGVSRLGLGRGLVEGHCVGGFLYPAAASRRNFKKLFVNINGDEVESRWVDTSLNAICRKADVRRLRVVVTNGGSGYERPVWLRISGGSYLSFTESVNISQTRSVSGTRTIPNRSRQEIVETVSVQATHEIVETSNEVPVEYEFGKDDDRGVMATSMGQVVGFLSLSHPLDQWIHATDAQISLPNSAYLTSLPTIEILSETGSGATAEFVVDRGFDLPSGGVWSSQAAGGSSYFSGGGMATHPISAQPEALGTSVDYQNSESADFFLSSDGLLYDYRYPTIPLPPDYQHGYSSLRGSYAFTQAGRMYLLGKTTGGGWLGYRAARRPVAVKNIEVRVADGGSGFTLPPMLSFSSQPHPDVASIELQFSGRVVSVGVERGGSGFKFPPSVVFTPTNGVGSGAAAVAVIEGGLGQVEVTSGGSGYLHPPKVKFSGAGIHASARAVINGQGVVTAVELQSAGVYRSPPSISFEPLKSVSQIEVTDGGSKYSSPPRVMVVADGKVGAAAAKSKIDGKVVSVTVEQPGSGYSKDSPPTVVFSGGDCEGDQAQGTAVVNDFGGIESITIDSPGSYYQSSPSIVLEGQGGQGARLSPKIEGPVSEVTITDRGHGFRSPPVVLFAGGGGTGAAAAASIAEYGSGAAATASINGSVLYVRVTNSGSGYEYSPHVTFSGGGNDEYQELKDALGAGEITQDEFWDSPVVPWAQCRINGAITGATVTSGGRNYERPSSELAIVFGDFDGTRISKNVIITDGIHVFAQGGGYHPDQPVDATISSSGQVTGLSPIPESPFEGLINKQFIQKPVVLFKNTFAAAVSAKRGWRRAASGLRSQLRAHRTAVPPSLAVAASAQGTSLRSEIASFLSDRIGPGVFESLNLSLDDISADRSVEVTLSSGRPSQVSFDPENCSPYARLRLVDAAISPTRCQATCHVDDATGKITHVTISSAGGGYFSPVAVIHGGGGDGCVATAYAATPGAAGGVAAIVVTSGGGGYSSQSPPQVYVFDSSEFMESQAAKNTASFFSHWLPFQYETVLAEYSERPGLTLGYESTKVGDDYAFPELMGSAGVLEKDYFFHFDSIESVSCGPVDASVNFHAYGEYGALPTLQASGTFRRPPSFSVSQVRWNPDAIAEGTSYDVYTNSTSSTTFISTE